MSTKFYNDNAGVKGTLAITLDYDMYWEDEKSWTPIVETVDKTLDGGESVRHARSLSEWGRPMTLITSDGQGFQKKSTVDALKAWAETLNKKAWVEIIDNSITITKKVRFNHTEGIFFEPHRPYAGNPATTFWYSGKIPMVIIQ